MSTTTANTFAAPASAGAAQDTLALIGRVLIALLFVPAGFGKLTGFAGVVGYKTRIVSIILAVFTVATAVIFHNFWAMPADKAYVNQLMFFKNIAIAGGLLAIAALGAGRFSVDRK